MRKRKNQVEAELKHMRMMNALYMKEIYPKVKSIKIKAVFTDPDDNNKFEKEYSWDSEIKALFEIDCPYRECVRGGFDISNLIKQAVESDQNKISGEFTCQGWQDKNRINKHRCLLNGKFDIKIVEDPLLKEILENET